MWGMTWFFDPVVPSGVMESKTGFRRGGRCEGER